MFFNCKAFVVLFAILVFSLSSTADEVGSGSSDALAPPPPPGPYAGIDGVADARDSGIATSAQSARSVDQLPVTQNEIEQQAFSQGNVVPPVSVYQVPQGYMSAPPTGYRPQGWRQYPAPQAYSWPPGGATFPGPEFLPPVPGAYWQPPRNGYYSAPGYYGYGPQW